MAPTIVTRAEWGAAPARNQTPRAAAQITTVHVHYADGKAPQKGEAAKQVRAIQMFHMANPKRGRGWWDIGYHFLVDQADAGDGFGTIYEGRPVLAVGAETEGHNTPSVGVCVLTDGPLTDAGRRTVNWLVAHLCDQLDHSLDVRPHSADVATACPGNEIRSWLADGRPTPSAPAEPPAPQTPSTPQTAPGGPVPPPTPPAAPTPPPDPVSEAIAVLPQLAKGADGQAVRNAQGLLAAHGATVTIDGDFGPRTDGSVRAFQRRAGLTVDGVVGPDTWAALIRA